MENFEITINTDGGSRGNPGPAASAFVVSSGDREIYSGSKYLGIATNNFAEYTGVLIALEWLLKTSENYSMVTFVLDSELVVKQLNGIYKVKDLNLQKLFLEIRQLINKSNKKILFKNVPRNQNKKADALVNIELDKNKK